jgi:hypothetical protein
MAPRKRQSADAATDSAAAAAAAAAAAEDPVDEWQQVAAEVDAFVFELDHDCVSASQCSRVHVIIHQLVKAAGDNTQKDQQQQWQKASFRALHQFRVDLQGQLAALQEQLHALGEACCLFAVPLFCNNPSCSNGHAPAELGLVSGRSCMCGGCRTAHYCSRLCQKQHWAKHKPVCKALVAAATAAGHEQGVPADPALVTA